MPTLSPRVKAAFIVATTAVLYVAAAQFRVSVAVTNGTLALVSPPTGITLSVVLLWGPIALPGVVIGALITYLMHGWPTAFVMAAAFGNALEAAIATYLLRRANVHMTFDRVVDVALLCIFAVLSSAVGASIGVTALWATGATDLAALRLWMAWSVSDVLGMLIGAPAVVALVSAGQHPEQRRRVEKVVAVGVVIGAAYVTFATSVFVGVERLPIAYFMLPLVMWIAIRLGPRYTAIATLVVTAIAVAGTSAGLGVFGQGPAAERVSLLLAYLVLLSLSSMVLAAVGVERDRATRRAWQLNQELEERVRERTDELAKAHDQLLERSMGLEAANRALEQQTSATRAQQLAALNLAEDAQQAQQMAVRAERALAVQAEELRLARDLAQAATATKSNFLATMSHEIRTPMNGIIGMTDLLLESPLSDAQREQLVTVQRSGHALLAIINDILDFSKVEAGKLVVEWLPTELKSAVDDVMQLLRPRALEKGLELSVEYAPGIPDAIETDPGRLRQVLTNLVGNAVKFTEAGRVRILVDVDSGSSKLRFRVVDTGPGIPADSQKHLFQPFTQLDVSTTRRFGGTGLGLAICRQLVELLGGEIGVMSPANERSPGGGPGSIFWFSLPATVPTTVMRSPSRQATAAPVASQRSSLCRVLVAEDNPVNQMVIRAMLQKIGIEPTLVADGRQAVDAIAANPFDLVLMDCQMPVMDGFEATRIIRDGSESRPVIVAVTANAMAGDAERCRAAGMDDYISKPISVRELRRVLSPWLDEVVVGESPQLTPRHSEGVGAQ
jgi:signal transduction histidine kinase/ActR/RegA family two-component response regulator